LTVPKGKDGKVRYLPMMTVPGFDDDGKNRVLPLRDLQGRWRKSGTIFDRDVEEALYDEWLERAAKAMFGHMNPRPPKELGWMTPREVADARRNRDRRVTCVICGGPLAEGSRSDKDTCSAKCRKAKSRRGTVHADLWPSVTRHAYVPRLDKDMSLISPLAEALREATLAAWRVPMPAGYPDEREWRMGQARALSALVRDERASGRPSVVRFRRRSRGFIRHMERLARVPTSPKPAALVEVSRQEALRVLANIQQEEQS
jgi:hypothetical protein